MTKTPDRRTMTSATWTVVNSGRVSLSLDRDVRATYLIVDGDQVEHRRVDYDLEKVADD